eukprot:scaffold14391_cov116-Isochrysis_galbana.AAC.4
MEWRYHRALPRGRPTWSGCDQRPPNGWAPRVACSRGGGKLLDQHRPSLRRLQGRSPSTSTAIVGQEGMRAAGSPVRDDPGWTDHHRRQLTGYILSSYAGPPAIDGLNKEKGVGKEWEGRGGVTGRQWIEVSRRAAASVSRVSTKDFFCYSKSAGRRQLEGKTKIGDPEMCQLYNINVVPGELS